MKIVEGRWNTIFFPNIQILQFYYMIWYKARTVNPEEMLVSGFSSS